MQLLEPIEAILPRRAQGYGEFIRRAAALARAGLPVPDGYALARNEADQVMARVLAPHEQPASLLDARQEFPEDAALADMAQRVSEHAVSEALSEELLRAFGTLRGLGARAVVVTAYLVCDKPAEERVLGQAQLGIETEARLRSSVAGGMAALFEPKLLRALRAVDVRSAGVALTLQRMVDGLISGIVYTRHPLTGDAQEWLVRAGYGLASAVRAADVPSDSYRLSRDGYLRDRVIVDKTHMLSITPEGARELRGVPEALSSSPSLDEPSLRDVTRLAERTERHVGAPVRVEWAIAQAKLYLLRADALPGSPKIPRLRAVRSDVRAREVWSQAELGEALPEVLSPLAWSLLRRFERVGLASTLAAAGATIGASSELLTDVRGRAFLNLGALTAAVRRLPGLSRGALARVGLDLGPEHDAVELAGPVDLSRAALRLYDSHARFGVRFGALFHQMAEERRHFAGLDARLLAPDAVERVLCDVEVFLRDAGTALMRVHGLWLATLTGFRALLARPLGADAARLERDLLWGTDELLSAQSGQEFLQVGRRLSRDPDVLAWADKGLEIPASARRSLEEFALKHRYEGMLMLDPMRPRWREAPSLLEGALRALVSDPLGLAFARERHEVARGRRERAEREWRRKLPITRWPLAQLLIKRLRELTRHREQLLSDTAQAIGVVREIVVDASRRLSMRYRDLGADSAFFLDLDELHAALARGRWDVQERVRMRKAEYALMCGQPRPVPRFQGRPTDAADTTEPLLGVAASGGAAEGRVYLVRHGRELSDLPAGSVLVVPACDVGLCAVLPAVRAVVSEQGGLTSHGTMLASALGVPVVVGVPGALARLRNGERVRVDAERTQVERLGSAP